MSPDVHMTVNSSAPCMLCEVNYTIWVEETDSCSQVVQQVPQLNKKNALYHVDCAKEDEKLYLKKVQMVSKIEHRTMTCSNSDPHSA